MTLDNPDRDPSQDESELTKPPSQYRQRDRNGLDRQHNADDAFGAASSASGPSDVTVGDHQTVDAPIRGDSKSARDLPRIDGSQPTDFGDYELLEEVARGGMGAVFKAQHKRLHRTVALKVILAGQFASEDDVMRFHREAEAAAILQHPGIVPVYEVGEVDGRHFFSMGFIEGTTLGDSVKDGPLDGRNAAALLCKIADAISYAHQRGVVHRDLKPGNILLDARCEPHVTDFGLAERIDSNSQSGAAGQVIGTPNYMAPEQALGDRRIGTRSDVYSLGAILYCLLTARPPFRGNTALKTMRRVIKHKPEPPRNLNPAVDRDLQAICLRCLEKDPDARYQTAQELKADLQRFLNLEPIAARPISTSARVWRWSRRNPVVSSLACLLVGLILALAVVGPSIAVHQSRLRAQADLLVLEKEVLIDNLNDSIQSASAARTRAEMSAHALHDNLVEMYIERGTGEVERGDPVAALPWYAAGLAMDAGDAGLEFGHRVRLASILQQIAPPQRIWQLSGETYNSAISPDGKLVAACGRRGDVAVWNVSNGQRIFHETSLGTAALGLQFSSDSKRLLHAAGSRFQVWNLTTGERVFPMVKTDSPVTAADLDATDQHIAIGLRNGAVMLHSARTGKLERTFSSHHDRVSRIQILSKKNRLLSCSHDHTAQLFELRTGELVARLVHQDHIVWGEFDPTAERIVTVSDDGLAKLWSAQDGHLTCGPLVHPARIRVASFDATGSRVATGAWDSAARIWDAESGDLIAGPMMHGNSIPRLHFSPDNRYLITASLDHTARIWDASSGAPVTAALQHGFLLQDAQFFPDGDRVMTASADRTVRVWEFRPLKHLVCQVQHEGPIKSCRLNPDGSLLLTAGSDGTARLWDAEAGEPKDNIILQHDGIVLEAEFSNDGKLIATASDDGRSRIWSASDGQQVTPDLQHGGSVRHVEFSPDDTQVLTASQDGAARLWDVHTGELIRAFRHARGLTWATFDHHGRQVLTCSEDLTGRVWDAHTGLALTPPLQHGDRVDGGGFSPDGKLVVTASNDHTAQIWEIATGAKVAPPVTHTGGIFTATFTPDSQHLVTGARDGSARIWSVDDSSAASPPMSIGRGLVRAVVSPCGRYIATAGGRGARLWNARTGRLLAGQMRHDDWVNEVRFSRDSSKLASAGEDGVARVWSVPSPDQRDVNTLQQLAALLSGYQVESLHGLAPVSPTELQELLARIHGE